ncbi:MAG: glycosyltransferase family 2 protein [Bacteroidia bacterium]|nr:glycosyltransferase family 2 protein [Bacteroidia bacterium]
MPEDLSIIIPTYNGAHKIEGVLNCLQEQTNTKFEVIVVVDGSMDNTLTLLQSLKNKLTFSLKIIDTPNKGRSHARNTGAKAANTNFLIFFDDDMLPEPECVANHLKFMKQHSKSVSIGAQINFIDTRFKYNDFFLYKKELSEKGAQQLLAKKQPLEKNALFLTAANFCIAKSDFENLRGFDENIHFQEDFDLGKKAFEQGINLYYNHSAFAYHSENISLNYLINQERGYIKGRKLVGQVSTQTHFFENTKHSLISLFVRMLFYPNLLDRVNYLIILPKFIRFKIYQYIVFSYAAKH